MEQILKINSNLVTALVERNCFVSLLLEHGKTFNELLWEDDLASAPSFRIPVQT